MPCPFCGHTRHYAGDGLLSCAECGRWLEADAEPVVTEADTPPAAQTERTVTIAGTGKGKRKGKR